MPKVSIIIPIYNVEKFLSECLDSCINQTLKDIEILCVNDKSPDNCSKILEEYSKKEVRIKVFNHEKNLGLASARNTGLKNATGEFVIFLDSDDLLTLDACENMYNNAVSNNSDLVVGDYYTFSNFEIPTNKPTERNSAFVSLYEKFGDVTTAKDIIDKTDFIQFYQQITFMVVWMKLYRRSVFVENNIDAPPLRCAEDFIMVKNFLFHSNVVTFLNDIVMYYRRHPDSFTSTKKPYCFAIFDSYKPALEIFKQNGYLEKEFSNLQTFFFLSYKAHLKNFCPYNLMLKFMWKMHSEIKKWNIKEVNLDFLNEDERKMLKIYHKPTLIFLAKQLIQLYSNIKQRRNNQ